MILSKSDLKFYLEEDRKALRKMRKRPRIVGDYIWKYQRQLRRTEYISNCKKGKIYKLLALVNRYILHKQGMKLGGFSIPLNCFGPGLSIAHYGSIVVNSSCKIGKNCRIHEGVTIGATNGSKQAAIIGDNVFIGTGAKIIGDLKIGNNIAIGANSVVTRTFDEDGITIAGIPAKKISNNNSHSNLSEYLNLKL